MALVCRGIRGATTAAENTRSAILTATRELLERIIAANDLCAEDIASVMFSTTADLNAEFPAVAARALGWHDTALFCAHEIAVPGSVKRCIRVLILWNTARRADEIVHIYLRGATSLRPEHATLSSVPLPDPFEIVVGSDEQTSDPMVHSAA